MAKRSTRLFRGLPVVDATMAMVVHIKRSDLTGGYTMLPNYCVVQHSIKRELHRDAWVHRSTAFVLDDGGDQWVRYDIPPSLKMEIFAHDRGGEFKAGDYRLKPPAASKRFGSSTYQAQKAKTMAKYHREKKRKPAETGKPARPVHLTKEVRERARYGGERADAD